MTTGLFGMGTAIARPRIETGASGLSLKSDLVSAMKAAGAFEVKIADPTTGFIHGIPSRNPLSLFPGCRSVVSFMIPNPAYATGSDPRENKEYPYTHPLVMLLLNAVYHAGAAVLAREGFGVYGDFTAKPVAEQIQNKLCAYEAGIGSYGRSGLILHPELGSRVVLFAFLTTASLPADAKAPEYCTGCRSCERACPGACFDGTKTYPDAFSPDVCHRTREISKQKNGTDCQTCVDICPVTKRTNEELIAWLEATYRTTGMQYGSPRSLPTRCLLHQNYPNPFFTNTDITYQLPASSRVTLKVLDVSGRELATLVDEYQLAGDHQVTFTVGRGRATDVRLTSGIYLYQLRAGSESLTRKMVLM